MNRTSRRTDARHASLRPIAVPCSPCSLAFQPAIPPGGCRIFATKPRYIQRTEESMVAGKMKVIWGLVILIAGSVATAQPATRPAVGAGLGQGQGAGRGEMLLSRLRDAMGDLKLTDDQKKQIDDIFAKAKDDISEMIPTLRNMDQQERQQKIREMMMGIRDKVAAVLTDEQKQQLQEKMQNLR